MEDVLEADHFAEYLRCIADVKIKQPPQLPRADAGGQFPLYRQCAAGVEDNTDGIEQPPVCLEPRIGKDVQEKRIQLWLQVGRERRLLRQAGKARGKMGQYLAEVLEAVGQFRRVDVEQQRECRRQEPYADIMKNGREGELRVGGGETHHIVIRRLLHVEKEIDAPVRHHAVNKWFRQRLHGLQLPVTEDVRREARIRRQFPIQYMARRIFDGGLYRLETLPDIWYDDTHAECTVG